LLLNKYNRIRELLKKKEVISIYFIKIFFVSIFPGILWVWYFYRKDRYDPEPKRLIVRDFIWGLLMVFPAGLLEAPLSGFLTAPSSLFTLFLVTVFGIGIIEEGFKSYVVYRLHYNHPEFDEPVDGIIYGVTVGLGFAALENMFYTILFGYQVGLIRAVLTTLAHASFTGIFGFYLARAKEENNRLLILFGYLLVSFLHGIYDFLAISGLMGTYTAILVIVILQIYLASLIRHTTERSPFK